MQCSLRVYAMHPNVVCCCNRTLVSRQWSESCGTSSIYYMQMIESFLNYSEFCSRDSQAARLVWPRKDAQRRGLMVKSGANQMLVSLSPYSASNFTVYLWSAVWRLMYEHVQTVQTWVCTFGHAEMLGNWFLLLTKAFTEWFGNDVGPWNTQGLGCCSKSALWSMLSTPCWTIRYFASEVWGGEIQISI